MSATPPRITIAIPNYNSAAFITESIGSVLRQTRGDFELLVIDDASTDDSANIVQSFSDPRIRFYQNTARLGLVGNWNACLERARGEYVCIFHDDDVMLPEMLERSVGVLEQHPNAGYVFSAIERIDALGNQIYAYRPPENDRICEGATFFREPVCGNPISASSVVTRRAAYAHVGKFDARLDYTPDWEMWMRLALQYDVAYIAETLTYRREHEQATSTHYYAAAGRDVGEEIKALQIVFDSLPPEYAALRLYQSKGREAIAARALQLARELLIRDSSINARGYVQLAVRLQPRLALDKGVLVLWGATFSFHRAPPSDSFYRAEVRGAIPPHVRADSRNYAHVILTNKGSGILPGCRSLATRIVRLAYHWYDTAGERVIWDGLRTPLPRDVRAGETITLDALVIAPPKAGDYVFEWDLVDEGVEWFSRFQSVAPRAGVSIE